MQLVVNLRFKILNLENHDYLIRFLTKKFEACGSDPFYYLSSATVELATVDAGEG